MYATPVLDDFDMNYSEILKGRLENVISLPTGLNSNHRGYAVYYASKIWVWTGTTWETWGGGGTSQFPENTFYVSRAFNNSSPYFSSLENLMNFLDINPPIGYIGILIYSGIYIDNTDIRYPAALCALGRVQFNSSISSSTSNLIINGAFYFERLTLQNSGTMIVKIDCESIGILDINGTDIQAEITARQIIEINSTFGNSRIRADEIQTVRLNGFAICKIQSNILIEIYITDEAKLTVSQSNIGIAGSISDSPIITEGGCFLKLENCRVEAGDYPSITVRSVDRLILSNVLLLTDDLYCIDAQSDCRLFLRGSCTINKPNNGNIIRYNQIEDFILEPDANCENW